MEDLENSVPALKDKSLFVISVAYEDENFEPKTKVLKFRKRYNGRMKILNLATEKISSGQLADASKILAKNAFVGTDEDKKIFENDDVVMSLMKHNHLFLTNAIAELQLD